MLFIFGLFIRLAYVLLAPQLDITKMGDPMGYTTIAYNLSEHRGYTGEEGNPDVFWPPGYPLFIAAIYKIFGISNTAVRIAQAFLGAITILLVYYIAIKVFEVKTAMLAAIITSVYPGFIGYAGIILPQLLAMFLMCAFIFILLNYKDNIWTEVILGIIAGFSVLVRPELLLFWPLLLFLTVVSSSKVKKYAVKRALVILVILCSLMSIWTVRNYKVFGKFIPVSTHSGDTLWISTWHEEWLEWQHKEPAISLAKGKNQIEISDNYFKAGINNIKEHPFVYLRMCFKRLYRLWFTGYSNTFDFMRGSIKEYFTNKEYGVFFIKIIMLAFNVLIVSLGFLGIKKAYSILPQSKRLITYLASPIIFTIVVHFFIYATPRYAIPPMPFMIIFASVAIRSMIWPVAK